MNKTIIVVEDDNDIRELLQDLLEGEGYLVETASNGREGLDKLKTKSVDLILLDLMMPVLDGRGFLAEYGGSAPVIVVTAVGERSGLPAGAAGVLTKPLHIEELLTVIKQHAC